MAQSLWLAELKRGVWIEDINKSDGAETPLHIKAVSPAIESLRHCSNIL